MKKSAFSLIELSIVILIIGILIAGVTQSSRLIAKMRLASARSITQSSEANSVKNMVFWLETTSEKSFDDAATEDTTSINSTTYSWYDINSQISQKSNASNAAGADYKVAGINGLPVLNFDGTSGDLMDISQANGSSTQMSVFIVFRSLALTNLPHSLISVRGVAHTGANNSFQVNINASSQVQYSFFDSTTAAASATSAAITINTPYLVDITDNGSAQVLSLSNGSGMTRTSPAAATTSGNKNFNGGFNIGSYNNGTTYTQLFNGDIAEIIFFDRGLKVEERNAIEKYLGKKWGIKTF
jgi:prepilin-type N-terminal cleavage/methylation domain-containing protein